MVETIRWEHDKLLLLDQRKLPTEEKYVTCLTSSDAAEAIFNLTVRGAPLIGVTAAMGFALGAIAIDTNIYSSFLEGLEKIKNELANTRPTAKNLFWALDTMMNIVISNPTDEIAVLKKKLIMQAQQIMEDDNERNKRIGEWGADLFNDADRVLTHCNAGALATAGSYGTALSPVRVAIEHGKKITLYADETRPVLQGARLTAWESMKDNIPVTVISDNSAGFLMARGMIDKIIVGADRIVANGDVANKIGTYSVAVLAKYHNIPFYVAAPLSTFDFSIANGSDIPIEERDPLEVKQIQGVPITPKNVTAMNFAFDVTPNKLITAIISEKGIAYAPFEKTLYEWSKI